ncbi:unnamed protein product [Aureobasidium vineae]|uniref:Uncharacterized protein n=1 Tax=Aureobasidium vineae TaxID=2773715 RepID=A0A9N8J6X9_9PEZI|nr:unnamed protein product [Aureobasidium vineae]
MNIRSEFDTLATYQIENEPAIEGEERSEPLPDRLVMPSLKAMIARDSTQEELQRVQYLIEECEDTDEFHYDNDLAAYENALQQILDDRDAIAPLIALRLHILISHVTTDQARAMINRERAEEIWQEQKSEWDLRMPSDVYSFMQATRCELDSLLVGHQDIAAAEAENTEETRLQRSEPGTPSIEPPTPKKHQQNLLTSLAKPLLFFTMKFFYSKINLLH